MKNKICIVRPTYYDRSAFLQISLEFQQRADLATDFNTHIFVDPHREYGYTEDYNKVITNQYHRINWPRNSGKYSWYDSVKYMFDNTDYDYVLSIEDDIIISKDYFRLCLELVHNTSILSETNNILYFHIGAWEKPRGDSNIIVRSQASSRSILIHRSKFNIIDHWIKQHEFIDNDNLITNILKTNDMTTIAPICNRHGHIGVYGWSSNHIHGNVHGKKTVFKDSISHEELYNLLNPVCLVQKELFRLNHHQNLSYFWDFDPNIDFSSLKYVL